MVPPRWGSGFNLFEARAGFTLSHPPVTSAQHPRRARLVLFGAVAMLALPTPADAWNDYWSAPYPYYYADDGPPVVRRKRPRPRPIRNMAPEPHKSAAKPVGPLIVTISIDRQRLKIFDANGLWAEAPVSTGTPGHPTPRGVFSIIQKNKWHRSNLYSAAPMPYMQRITWSGVALHAGVLPGYPASHGCIRLPASFAARLWTWTRLGARVVITGHEMAPADFSHPRLITRVALPAEKTVQVMPAAPRLADNAAGSGGERIGLRLDRVSDGEAPVAVGGMAADADKKQAATAAGKPDEIRSDTRPDIIAPKRTGQIAAFVSRKERKLFVRQGFEAWFETPVTIEDPDRPIGTHVFTAQMARDDANLVRWTVLSMPPETAKPPRKSAGRGKAAEAAPAPVAVSPAEAIGRVTIPQEALERIAAAIGSGSSLTISDHGLGPETGKGTDFIVLTR
ncbi:MAG: L,D-transpeptidase [Xanthobacteraceae bacterium]|nr:MAG: L,D-transpeptidase [Xanthobacteraceae bacterium]